MDKTEQRKLAIIIDPGHGGDDPGAVYGGVTEADINLRVASRLWGMLEEAGHRVAMTRKSDGGVSLARRCAMEHAFMADMFISLHCNAAENQAAHGMEVWTSPGDTGADPLATEIAGALGKAFADRRLRTDFADRDPDKEARFYVLVHTLAPAVLVEMGFISNPADRAWLTDPEAQTDIAAVIAQGIESWSSERLTA